MRFIAKIALSIFGPASLAFVSAFIFLRINIACDHISNFVVETRLAVGKILKTDDFDKRWRDMSAYSPLTLGGHAREHKTTL